MVITKTIHNQVRVREVAGKMDDMFVLFFIPVSHFDHKRASAIPVNKII